MKISLALFALVSSILVAGCSTITEKDLADLQSPNAIVKRDAVLRISRGPGFPLTLMNGLVSRANEKEAVAIMVELLHDEKECKDVQLNILTALGELGKETEVPVSPVIEKLNDKDPQIRLRAIETLAKTKNREALSALLKLMEEKTLRKSIIWALGEIGDPGAISTLNSLLAADDQYERYNAYKALAKIATHKATHKVEGRVAGDSRTNSLLNMGKIAFKTYQDMMMIVLHKIAGSKKA